jgi:fibronectin-binding autotransporter adhesin
MKRNPLYSFLPLPLALLVSPLLLAWPNAVRAADKEWIGAANGTWQTVTNYTGGGTFPGDATLNVTGEGLSSDIFSVAPANTGSPIGINFTNLGGLSLGAIDVNKTDTAGVNIGPNANTSGVLQLNGATVGGVGNTILRCNGEANLTLSRLNLNTTPQAGSLEVRLGSLDSVILVGANAAAAARTLTILPTISEANVGSGFSKTGIGTLVLSGANTYTGTTVVADGVVRLQSSTGAGAGTVVVRNNDNAAQNNNDVQVTGGLTYANPLTLENAGNGNARARLSSVNTSSYLPNVWNGQITFKSSNSPAAGNQALIPESAPLIINGNIVQDALASPSIFIRGGSVSAFGVINGNIDLGSGTLNKTDDGTWTINSDNNKMGAVTVSAGTLVLAKTNALEADTALTIGQTGVTTGRLVVNTGVTQDLVSITTPTTSTSTVGHSIVGGGAINFGPATATINAGNSTTNTNELTIAVPILGSGGFTKSGTGNLIVSSAVEGPVVVSAGGFYGRGTLATSLDVMTGGTIGGGTPEAAGTLTAASVNLGATTNIVANVGSRGSDYIANTGSLQSGGTTIQVIPNGAVNNGTVPIIGYSGAAPATSSFDLAFPMGGIGSRATASVVDTGTAIGIDITGADSTVWTGAADSVWDISNQANWKLGSDNSPTQFRQMDAVEFPDGASQLNVTLGVTANPVRVHFTNTTGTDYTLSGTGSLGNGASASTMVLDKTGSGTVTLATANTYSGPTTVSDGRLISNVLPGAATAVIAPIPTASPVNVTGSGVVRISADNTNATAVVANILPTFTGDGVVEHQPRAVAGQTSAVASALTNGSPNFTGTWRLLSPASGTARLTSVGAHLLGSAKIEVQSGHQFYTAAGNTYNNAITIAGKGYQDSAALLGALRLEAGSIWAGAVTIDAAGARICSHNTSVANGGQVTGPISGGPLEVNNSNFPNNCVVFITNSNNSYSTTTVGGTGLPATTAPQTGTGVSMRLVVGNATASGSLGDGPVTLIGENPTGNAMNAIIGFDRTDGFTLKPGNTITAAGGAVNRTFVDCDSQGTGFSNNGVSIDLGTPGTAGGSLRVGSTRAGAIANLDGTIEAGTFVVGQFNSGLATGGTANLVGGTLSATAVSVSNGGSSAPHGNTNGSTLNVNAGANLNAVNTLYVGEGLSSGGNLNVNGGTVSVGQQLRIAHWGSAVSTMNMTAGSVTLLGESSLGTPSTAAGGGAATVGDNNLNTLATAATVGGGIYLGNDGTGVLNHSGGEITTNWIVLDNRGNSTAGGDGIDRYNISGTATLRLRSEWGIIARNVSTEVRLGGGTIILDNSGTGGPAGNTGADLDVPLDTPLSTVAGTTTVLETTTPENSFIIGKAISGAGNLSLEGGGLAQILAGSASPAYTGTFSATLSRLQLDGTLAGSQLIKNGATLLGNGTGGTVTVESGGKVAPGASVGRLSATSLDLQAGGQYEVEITGATSADQLVLSGNLTANGTVKVVLVGYAPSDGDVFDVVNAAGTTGTPTFDFSTATLAPGLTWDTSQFATTGTLRVAAANMTDAYTTWASANGLTGGKFDDDDGDGVKNILEFATNSDPKDNKSGARTYASLAPLGGDSVLTLTVAVRRNAAFAPDGTTQKAAQDGVLYTVEGTSDLQVWDSTVTKLNAADGAAVRATLTLPALDSDWEWQTFRTDDGTTGDPRDFIHLQVAVAP